MTSCDRNKRDLTSIIDGLREQKIKKIGEYCVPKYVYKFGVTFRVFTFSTRAHEEKEQKNSAIYYADRNYYECVTVSHLRAPRLDEKLIRDNMRCVL